MDARVKPGHDAECVAGALATHGYAWHTATLGTANPSASYGSRSTASARAWARGASVSISRYSSGECARPPTGPTAQMVGVPVAAAKPESAQPPVNSAVVSTTPSSFKPAA